MIFFAELFMTGEEHAPFNAALLQALQKAFPEEALVVYASTAHWKAIQAITPPYGNISFHACEVLMVKSGDKIQWLRKLTNEARQFRRLLQLAEKQQPRLICFAFLSPLGQWLASRMLRHSNRRQQVLIFLHGLEILKAAKQVKWIDRCYAYLLRKAFRTKAAHKKYLTLVPSAKDYLIAQGYLSANELDYIPHPYVFTPLSRQQASDDNPLVFAHLGVARLDKQSQLFFELAAHFKREIQTGKARFQVIGPVLPEMQPYLNDWVDYHPLTTFLDRSTYEQALAHSHYTVFCYAADAYELTGSGAVMDAIAAHRPILALRNPSFQYLFEQAGKAPGQLFDNLQELQQGIQAIIDQEMISPTDYGDAFVALQQYYSIDSVAKRLKQVMNDEL